MVADHAKSAVVAFLSQTSLAYARVLPNADVKSHDAGKPLIPKSTMRLIENGGGIIVPHIGNSTAKR